jgi:transcriptional antiterminator RfaH
MDLWRSTNWYAVHTKPGQERLVKMNIERLGLEVLLPSMRAEKLVWGIPHVVLKPLFPRYLFARFCPIAYLHSILYARGVYRVVSSGETPLAVDEEIIRTIRSRIGAEGYVRMDERPMRPGDRVMVKEGLFQGMTGIFERELKDRERVVLLLEAIEYQARVLIQKRHLKAADQRA